MILLWSTHSSPWAPNFLVYKRENTSIYLTELFQEFKILTHVASFECSVAHKRALSKNPMFCSVSEMFPSLPNVNFSCIPISSSHRSDYGIAKTKMCSAISSPHHILDLYFSAVVDVLSVLSKALHIPALILLPLFLEHTLLFHSFALCSC